MCITAFPKRPIDSRNVEIVKHKTQDAIPFTCGRNGKTAKPITRETVKRETQLVSQSPKQSNRCQIGNMMKPHTCMCVMLCYVMLCYVKSCHVMSCHVMSCHVMSRHVTSCHDMSCW